MKYYFVNPLANNGIKADITSENQINVVGLDYVNFFEGLKPEDEVVLVGGDGTINHFINEMDGYKIKNNVYLYPNGTGNDFLNDINGKLGDEILINKYFENLPTVTVQGFKRKFINNMGFGIDGYCCEVADRMKVKEPNKKIDYTAIAIKGLLFHFKPCHAKVTVDDRVYEYDNVWLAPAMKGRYYGGGMMVAPAQDRFSDVLTCVVYTSKSKLAALMNFPSIFEGKHVEKTDMVKVMTGKKIHVEYSRPCAAQIDGDTVLNVSEYWAEI